uniref:RRM domain-containing protein n=1 Tax=Hyaloperonospora arabidopsidis (strain Emoy2) TaxID=559515 RepID=M4C6F7_HYAAE
MTPAPQKDVKQELNATALNTTNGNGCRNGHVVIVTSVPSALCASESTVRHLFAGYGTLLSVTVHHNFLDMEPDGFMYLEYSEKEAAEAAVAAVEEKSVGSSSAAAAPSGRFKNAVLPSAVAGMKAALALARGVPQIEVDEEVKDLLLGRQEVNRFTQSQQELADEEDLILQSLSQHSLTSSQPKAKRDKRRKSLDTSVGTRGPKKTRKVRY